MSERWTPKEFMAKASWEGSWTALADWGGKLEDEVPEEISDEWSAFVDAYEALEERRRAFARTNDSWEWQ